MQVMKAFYHLVEQKPGKQYPNLSLLLNNIKPVPTTISGCKSEGCKSGFKENCGKNKELPLKHLHYKLSIPLTLSIASMNDLHFK